MRGRYKRKNSRGRSDETADRAGLSALPGETAADSAESDTPVPGVGGRKRGARCSMYGDDKVYLGVRVKMPVKDLLRNIRVAQGWEPQDLKQRCGKTAKGDMKRVKTRSRRQTVKGQHPTKSLEELAIIVEVLEEDLRTGNTYTSSPRNLFPFESPVSPELSPTGAGYSSDEYSEMIPSPESYTTYSPGTADYYQAQSPPDFYNSLQPPSTENITEHGERGEEWSEPQNHNWEENGSAFFWTQLQREESQLGDVSDAVLLATDEHGRTALHNVMCVGKRALGYAIAKRMATLNSLDLKDSDGMTALLYAAKYNHHLMVADLIYLGANINETNNSGKSCLHLSAENGYIRVLEVLKEAMMNGVYVDVEATDKSGLSVLQCVAVALKTSVSELENSQSHSQTRLHMLRQEQMMETLEFLLQMSNFPSYHGEPQYAAQDWPSTPYLCPAGHFGTPTVMF
ncbi:NF-kappa-B inhibitor zeta [Acanthochromis polyacanthus]|uniref:NF-kappa-B inhibitor zeta n=1 Tax=Acanthochromis polyacanthus TaxID=80966 RepID=UPI0022342BC8|nr:NF-kappa-B inhibitor zeta [Acanthochromis polyacanthus]